VKELKGFEMVELQPNESKKITFTINEKTIEFFTANSKWEAETGDFKVFIGGSSAANLEMNFHYSN
jgi:beta-glucosidase